MKINPIQTLLVEINGYCARSGMSASAFGAAATGDPNLYRQLKSGERSPTQRTLDRVRAFMDRDEVSA